MKHYFLVGILLFFMTSCRTSNYSSLDVNSDVNYDSLGVSQREVQRPLNRGLVIIDPGHGGEDRGTKSRTGPPISEKSMNLVTAKFLAEALHNRGFRTLLTRHDDTFIPLVERAEFANERRPLLFVSIHFNAASSTEAQGIEVFYFKPKESTQRTQASKKLATAILASLIAETGAPSRGVKQGDYAVIRETKMPAVLVEGGFLTNEEELQKLKHPQYLKKIAEGIAKGIHYYAL